MTAHSEKTLQIFFLAFSTIFVLILFLSKFLDDSPRARYFLSKPSLTLLVSIFCSFLVSFFLVPDNIDVNDEENDNSSDTFDLATTILLFPRQLFFMALLPTILFNSGYQLQRELFFRHIKPIALQACFGTCICAFGTGFSLYFVKEAGWIGDFDPTLLELLAFGSLIAATDTVSIVGILEAKRVDPHLYSLVFGESALNDAVAIVLYKTLADFLENGTLEVAKSPILSFGIYAAYLLEEAVFSPLLGVLFSFLMGLAFKYVDLREHQLLELSLYVFPIYIPYMVSELLGLSGIISIFFAGISAKRYMEPNVSMTTKGHANALFRLISFLAETCIFIELGFSVFGLSANFQWNFIGFAFIAILLGRASSVYPLSLIYNLYLTRDFKPRDERMETLQTVESDLPSKSWESRTPHQKRDKHIPLNFMHFLWFSGLRGAVAYACACHFPDVNGHKDQFVASTMIIVLITIILMGGATEALLEYLQIPVDIDEKEYMRQWRMKRRLRGRLHWFGKLHYWGAVHFIFLHTQEAHTFVFLPRKNIISYIATLLEGSARMKTKIDWLLKKV